MTIASTLFYHRRYHATRRSSDVHPPEDLAGDRDATSTRRASRSRRGDHEDFQRSACRAGSSGSRRQLSHCVAGQSELETIRLDKSNGEFAVGIRSKHGHETSRVSGVRVRRDELDQQLPCSVLQARARLVERLRDFHFADSREQVPSQVPTVHEHTSADRASITDSRDVKAGTAADFFVSGISHGHVLVNHQTDEAHWSHNMNKPLISCSGTFSSLRGEVFESFVSGDNVLMTLPECSICLERFLDGEKLMRLPCEHRFHQSCLYPWLQAHGVCPYCRADC